MSRRRSFRVRSFDVARLPMPGTALSGGSFPTRLVTSSGWRKIIYEPREDNRKGKNKKAQRR